ncbi:MAG: toll/interleukin-1 receptor domain-containing protein, partial [Bifidobacteriaceae bacterium]|nr:toll/interleukin-1 receptor domain-containing protein [Bifidobacteriaceae bacterium]
METPPPPFGPYRGDRPYAFVSYAHADAYLVYDLIAALHDDGYLIWYDNSGTPLGERWHPYEGKRVEDCALFLAFFSPVALNREEIKFEVDTAHKAGKPILVVELEPTTPPDGIAAQTRDRQWSQLYAQGRDQVLADIREAFDRHGVTREPSGPGAASADSATGRADETQTVGRAAVAAAAPPGLPPRPQPVCFLAAREAFVDRIQEGAALQASARRQDRWLRGEESLPDVGFLNVLAFHGGGGVGKTGLSQRLQSWASGELGDDPEWGPWPDTPRVPVRWDFHNSSGNLDLVASLVELRKALTPSNGRFRVFDLLLAAYLEGVRSDQNGLIGGWAGDEVLMSLQHIASELHVSIPAALTAPAIRHLSDAVLARPRPPTLAAFPELGEVLARCRNIREGSQAPEVAAELMYILTKQIYFMPPAERPALVFFLDAFEHVQRRGTGSPESVIAHFVVNSPYALFVVTGRERLDWAEANRTDLGWSGRTYWPGLADGASEDPRQHLLERLSDEDTRRAWVHARDAAGWNIDDGLIGTLVERAHGLPLHIDVVCTLAASLDSDEPGRVFTAADLDGELPELVARLTDQLEPAERDAFRAACVLPFFDETLVRAVAQVRGGDVRRAIQRALVDQNPDSLYPWRVHDEIRRLVRIDRTSQGYWSDSDWRDAAERGLDEAVRRIAASHGGDSDAAEIEAITLAIRLAYEWKTYRLGLAKIVTDAPTIAGLARFMPEIPENTPSSDIVELIRFIQAVSLPYTQAVEALEPIRHSGAEVAVRAARWKLYRMRAQGRHYEAISLIREVIGQFPGSSAYNHWQLAATLRYARRFKDALAEAEEHTPERLEYHRQIIDRAHGILTGDLEIARRHIEKTQGKRFRFELEMADLWRRSRVEGVSIEEISHKLEAAISRRATSFERSCLDMLGCAQLTDRSKVDQIADRIRKSAQGDEAGLAHLSHLLSLRALMT